MVSSISLKALLPQPAAGCGPLPASSVSLDGHPCRHSTYPVMLPKRRLVPKFIVGIQASSIAGPSGREGPIAAAAAAVATPISPGNIEQVESSDINHPARQLEDVVIVGGGIAGLATALALHRLGIKSILLEKSDRLRTAGSSIGVWTNAWRALEALGVAQGFRDKFSRLTGFRICASDGKELVNMPFRDAGRDVELRAVERKALLEVLREPLPKENIRYDAQVVAVRRIMGGYTEVELENGSKIQTKVLVGCDGVGSVVARWMGLKDTLYCGYIAIRGLAIYSEGHKFDPVATQMLGNGVRAGLVPMDSNKVYWFVVFNSPSENRITDPELVRKEALSYVKGWPDVITEMINSSPLETLSRRAISDRWNWEFSGSTLYKGGVTLAGDAMHPMTPNLGQGGCLALEDAVILGRTLAKVLGRESTQVENGPIKETNASKEMENIELALKSYTEVRKHRVLPLAVRSFAIGALLQLDIDIVCKARNLLLPRILVLERFIDHTFYDCGTL